MGAALTETGKTKSAVKAFEQAAADSPTNVNVRHALAQALARDGQRERARREYQAILGSFELDEKGHKTILQELEALPE